MAGSQSPFDDLVVLGEGARLPVAGAGQDRVGCACDGAMEDGLNYSLPPPLKRRNG